MDTDIHGFFLFTCCRSIQRYEYSWSFYHGGTEYMEGMFEKDNLTALMRV